MPTTSKPKITLENERRKRYLETLIKEAIINVLAEQDTAVAPVPAPPPPPAPPVVEELPPDDTEEPQQEEFTVDSMIERLNVIRGGKSFTDPVVYGQLVTYFKSLDDTQKTYLQSFLMSLGKIVINVQDEDKVTTPPPEQRVQPPPAPPAPAAAPAQAPSGNVAASAPPIAEASKNIVRKSPSKFHR